MNYLGKKIMYVLTLKGFNLQMGFIEPFKVPHIIARLPTTISSTSSGTFLVTLETLLADEWENMIGALETCKTALMVSADT